MRGDRLARGRGHEQRVTVLIGLGREIGGDRVRCPGPVIDDEGLTEDRLILLGQRPGDEVGAATGRGTNHDADRLGRPVLRDTARWGEPKGDGGREGQEALQDRGSTISTKHVVSSSE